MELSQLISVGYVAKLNFTEQFVLHNILLQHLTITLANINCRDSVIDIKVIKIIIRAYQVWTSTFMRIIKKCTLMNSMSELWFVS